MHLSSALALIPTFFKAFFKTAIQSFIQVNIIHFKITFLPKSTAYQLKHRFLSVTVTTNDNLAEVTVGLPFPYICSP